MVGYDDWQTGVSAFLGIFFGLPAFLLLLYLFRCFRVVEQGTNLVIERCGRFHKRADAGFHFLIPFVDRPREVVWRNTDVYTGRTSSYSSSSSQHANVTQTRSAVIDLRETVMDFPNQPVVTRDNVKIDVHPMLLVRVIDPVRLCYETYDPPHALEKLVQTTLRSIIGEMGLDDTLCSREEIERSLKSKISRIAFDWGLQINSIEILEITPTPVVQTAMHQQLSAERIRRAAIVSADGQREKMKLEAEGECQSAIALATGDKQVAIVRSQGQAEARRLIARAEADSVRIIGSALAEYGVDPTQYIIGCKYIESLTALAGNARSREVFFPLQTDIAGALTAVNDVSPAAGGAATGVGGSGSTLARVVGATA